MQTNSSNSQKSPFLAKSLILEWMLMSFHPEIQRINTTSLSVNDWELIDIDSQKAGLNSRIIEILNTSNFLGIIPPKTMSSLKTARILAIQRNLMLLDEFSHISKEFYQKNVPHQAIKGLWILQHPELLGISRITSDIDLLVPPGNLAKAIDIVRKLGYHQDPSRSRFDVPVNFKSGHHLIPFRKNGISVEIHFKALPGSCERFNNELVQQSKLRDHFSVIFLHFIRHNINGDPQLKWLVDILRLFHFLKPEDLQFIKQTIKNDQNSAHALKLIDVLNNWYNCKTPWDEVNDLIYLLKDSNNQPNHSLRDLAKKVPKRMAGVKYICAAIFPRHEYLRFIYPQAKKFPLLMLYPLRWYQLGRKLGLMPIKSISKKSTV